MEAWNNINSSSSNSSNNNNSKATGKLMLTMRSDGAFFYGPRSSISGLEDHSSASAAVRENLLQYPGSFEGPCSDQESADVEVSDHEAQIQPAEKKRRLSVEQVKSLELNFEMENKLEPERKKQLAHELGLQPRQVAVWFQNRRARWKTKQLERDYEALKASYDALVMENKKLQAEVTSLAAKLEAKAPEGTTATTVEQKKSVAMEEARELAGKSVVPEDMEVVSNCKAINNNVKEGSPCSDGYTSEILDAEYQVEAVPVVEENVLPFEQQQQQQILMDSPTKLVIKDHHQPDGMVYDAHTNQLVLYRYEDYCNHEFDNSSSSFYFSPDQGLSPWWT